MGTPFSGKYGRFQVNGSNAAVDNWTADLNVDIIEATSFEDQVTATGRTSEVVIAGVDRCSATVSGYVDSSAMPGTFGFFPGTALTNVKLFLNKTVNSQCVTIPTAVVAKINYQTPLKDKVKFSLEIRSSGPFTQPT